MSDDHGDQLDRDNRQRDPDNDPPHSRVFIVCGKGTTEEELEGEFKPYGQLQYCKIIKDKNTGESKGFAYAKYDKASSAALAIESLNGKKISEDQPAFKVMIADAKGTRTNPRAQSREPEDLPPRSRLFVICSKDYTEDDVNARFKPYGEIEYCKVIKDKQSNESKGFAYVKFAKASAAALAMEEVNRLAQENGLKIKALIADPKSKNKGDGPLPSVSYPPLPAVLYEQPMLYPHDLAMPGAFPMPGYMPTSRQRLFVVHHKSVTQEQLARLFSRFPGMEYCDLKKNKQTGEAKGFAYINYSTPQAALMAKDQMDGYEFPVGNALKVMFAEPLGVKGSGSASETPAVSAMSDRFAHMGMSYPPPPAPMGYAHNLPPPPPMSPSDSSSKAMQSNDRNYPEGSRLFVILSNPLPNYLLQDLFSKYGALEYVRLQKDKNYGYAKYTTQAAAQIAMTYLNNLEFHGQKITITPALPPNSDSRKRPRI